MRPSPRPAREDMMEPARGARPALRLVPQPVLSLHLLGPATPQVELDGVPVEFSRVGIDLLALLAVRPEGLSSEELAAELYGDAGRPGAVRVQVCRVRKKLGPWLETAPYRLVVDIESDAHVVWALLERGAIREAAAAYSGALLPRSEAPGVVRVREQLEGWLRQAVMTADDAEALWGWVQSASGREDLGAWKRLLANLDYQDPRRSLAAWHVRSLRAAYTDVSPPQP
jgi:hypothetical protein